jgi:hypothetical protein
MDYVIIIILLTGTGHKAGIGSGLESIKVPLESLWHLLREAANTSKSFPTERTPRKKRKKRKGER